MHPVGKLLVSGLCVVAGSSFAAAPRKPHAVKGLRIAGDTTVVTQPLNDLGYPDFTAALDAELGAGVAPEENFWVAFDEALPRKAFSDSYFALLTARPGFEKAASLSNQGWSVEGVEAMNRFHSQTDPATSRPWKRDEFPLVARWIESHDEVLQRASEAARRVKAYDPLIGGGDQTLAMVLLPHVQESRNIARLLAARVFLALGEGRSDDAWQDVLTMHRMARHLEKGPSLISRLVGTAIESIARQPAEATITADGVTAEQLRARWREFAEILKHESADNRWIRFERLCTVDLTLALRAERAVSDELIAPPVMISLPGGQAGADGLPAIDLSKARKSFQRLLLNLGDVNDVLKFSNRYYDAVESAFALQGYQDRLQALKRLQIDFVGGENSSGAGEVAVAFLLGGPDAVENVARSSVLRTFSSAFEQFAKADTRRIARERLLHAAFAAQLNRLETGRDVASADELASAIERLAAASGVRLPEMRDPYCGEHFHVAARETQLVIFCVGDDLESDGGKTFGEGEGCDDLVVILQRSIP